MRMLSIHEQLDRERKRAQHEQHELNRVQAEFAGFASSLALLKLEFALRRKYDPNQPRVPAGNPDGGQWTSDDGRQRTSEDHSSPEPDDGDFASIIRASRRRRSGLEAICEAQYERDMMECRMVRLPACYAQAMVRRVACERGHPIPPLVY